MKTFSFPNISDAGTNGTTALVAIRPSEAVGEAGKID